MAYKLLLEKRITERGIVAYIPVDGWFQVKGIGTNGEIYGLICPYCGKEHLKPGKLQKYKDQSMREEVIMFNSIFCPIYSDYFDVYEEMIFMTIRDAEKYKLY
ncbi:MAG: hypothetical protein FWC47_15280 [Oscillospiraceae bacterium]|nr:hypothetical protein [Oscillospiraceae bacterium]